MRAVSDPPPKLVAVRRRPHRLRSKNMDVRIKHPEIATDELKPGQARDGAVDDLVRDGPALAPVCVARKLCVVQRYPGSVVV